MNAITAVALSALALLGGFHRGLTPPPAPEAALPSTPAKAAGALVSTDASLRAAIDRWLASGAARPNPDVTLYALYEQRLYRKLARNRAFAGATLAKVVERIHQSWTAHPRDMFFIYFNHSAFDRCIEGQPWLQKVHETSFCGFYRLASAL